MILRMRFLTAFLALNITTNLQIRIRDLSVALRVLVAFTSLFIYGASVIALHQDRFHPISVEGGPAGAALSHRLLGSPLGLQDSGFAHYLRFQTEGLSAAQFVRRAVEVAPNTQSHEYVLAPDGQGVGTIVAWTLAFWFFGLHAHSITYLYLLIIAVSAIAFLVRYPDERMAAVPIFLLSLTLLLVTPVSALPVGLGALIGGSRYYAVVGILPALHWCFEFLRVEDPPQIRTATRYRLLAIQIAILGLAVLVRGAPGYLLGPIAASAIFGWWRSRGASSRRRVLLLFFVPMAVLIVGLTMPPRLAFPEFAAQGRLYGLVWHRAFIGFIENPAWPFPGMREKYDCSAQISDGLTPGVLDRNGLCVWDAYGPNRTRSMEEVGNELFDGNYETALRQAFFDVIRSYPKQAFETFMYFKPKRMIKVIFDTLDPRSWDAARAIELLTALQIAVFVVFIGIGPAVAPFKVAARQLGILVLFMVPALAPQLLTFTAAPTAIDMLTYTLSGCAIVFWLVVSWTIKLIKQRPWNA